MGHHAGRNRDERGIKGMALPAEWKKTMDGWIDPQAGRRQVNGGLLEKLTEKLWKQRSPMTGHLQAGVPRMQEGWLGTSPKTSGPSVTLHSSLRSWGTGVNTGVWKVS